VEGVAMKRENFGRFIDAVFAAKGGEEMSCSDYFDQLPRYVELEASGEDTAALLPEVRHHMHQCPECEELYLGLLEALASEKKPGGTK
jgi:hypothetical protein